MRNTILLIISCFLWVLNGCSFVAKTVHGVKKPKEETPETITTWLKQQGIEERKILTIKPSSFYQAVLIYSSGPMLFNNKGKFISVGYNYDDKFCPKGVDEFLQTIIPGFEKGDSHLTDYVLYGSSEKPDTAYPSIKQIMSYAGDIEGKGIPNSYANFPSDYIFIIPFKIFAGKRIQTKEIRKYITSIQKNRSAKIEVILINFDKQKWWGDEWNKNINIEF